MSNATERAIVEWAASTPLHSFVVGSQWVWPTLESLHYIGLAMLFGAVGLYDLRVLGLARAAPLSALQRLLPWGAGGFAINLVTGVMFFTGTPSVYVYNDAFRAKLMLLTLAGLNLIAFYTWVFAGVRSLGAGEDAPLRAKVCAGVSLFAWLGVMTAGRLLTFYRP
jgi:uncharacterized membrane protein